MARLQWEADWGRRIAEDKTIQAWIEAGEPFPPWDNQPPLPPELAFVWTAYYRDLMGCRAGSEMPVQWTAIHEYAQARGIVRRERFERLVRVIDRAYLATKRAENAHAASAPQTRGTNARRGTQARS